MLPTFASFGTNLCTCINILSVGGDPSLRIITFNSRNYRKETCWWKQSYFLMVLFQNMHTMELLHAYTTEISAATRKDDDDGQSSKE